MTTSDHSKVLKQIGGKPGKLAKYKKNNVPKTRKQGDMTRKCKTCGRTGSHVSKYGIHLCRHCFRDNALEIGFKKYS